MNILLSQLTKLSPTIKHCLIDVETAKTILSERNYENQRKLKSVSIRQYVADMKAGEWGEISIIRFGCSVENSRWRLTDGQHRLTAVISSELPQTFKIEFDTFETENDLKIAYGQMDRGAMRTDVDAMRVYGEAEVGQGEYQRFVAAIKHLDSGFKSSRITRFPVAKLRKLFVEWEKYMVELSNLRSEIIISKEMYDATRRSSTIAVFMYLIRYANNKSQAYEFIKAIYQDSGLISNDPRKHAVEVLKGFYIKSNSKGKWESIDARQVSCFLIACWNNFSQGKKSCRRPPLSGNDSVFLNTTQFGELPQRLIN